MINLAPGVYREQLADRPRRRARRTDHDQGPGDRARTAPVATGRCCTAPAAIFSVNHSYYTFDGFTIDGQEKLARHAFPTDLAAIDRVQERRAAPGRRRSADLRRRGRRQPRPHRHHDHQHVPQRGRRGVRAAAEQRPRQRRSPTRSSSTAACSARATTTTGPSTTTAKASTSAPARTPTSQPMHANDGSSRQRRHPQHHPHLRLRVLQREGERARQRVRGQRLLGQHRIRGVRRQQHRAARLRATSSGNNEISGSAGVQRRRSRATARSTTRAATSSRTTGSRAARPR